jgi:hypothetical protein
MSRKLIFAAGLLHCFFCHLDEKATPAKDALKGPKRDVSVLTEYVERQLRTTPLDLVAKACLELNTKPETARSIFGSYDRFLGILDDREKRAELEEASAREQLRDSKVWNEIRDVSRPFDDSLVALFLRDDEGLRDLTMKYGVF